LGLPADADKDHVKLCATWIDVEINLTLVSHWKSKMATIAEQSFEQDSIGK
jgi:hypothetical protein